MTRKPSWSLGLAIPILCLAFSAGGSFALPPPATAPAATVELQNTPLPEQNKAPVVLKGKTLFYVQERVYSFSPEERAKAISDRIRRLYEDSKIAIDSIHIEELESSSDIVTGDYTIMAVTDKDALAAGRSRKELAEQYAELIRQVAKELEHDYSLRSIVVGGVWTLVLTVVLLLAFKLLSVFFARLYGKLNSWKGTRSVPCASRSLNCSRPAVSPGR